MMYRMEIELELWEQTITRALCFTHQTWCIVRHPVATDKNSAKTGGISYCWFPNSHPKWAIQKMGGCRIIKEEKFQAKGYKIDPPPPKKKKKMVCSKVAAGQ